MFSQNKTMNFSSTRIQSSLADLPAKSPICVCVALLLLLAASNGRAAYHAWDINEIYSNPDGTVQFIELRALGGSQQFMNNAVTIRATNSTVTNIFVCNSNLPADTLGRFCIIGTSNLTTAPGGVRPDFFIPPNFIPQTNGFGSAAVLFLPNSFPANIVAAVYTNLPKNGDAAIIRSGANFITVATNSPRNFNQQSNVIVPVKFLAANKTDTNFVVSFRTATGVNGSAGPNYAVEGTGAFGPASWSAVTNFIGGGVTQTVAIPITAGTNQFFRLRVP